LPLDQVQVQKKNEEEKKKSKREKKDSTPHSELYLAVRICPLPIRQSNLGPTLETRWGILWERIAMLI